VQKVAADGQDISFAIGFSQLRTGDPAEEKRVPSTSKGGLNRGNILSAEWYDGIGK
jgi:hypothetical protein